MLCVVVFIIYKILNPWAGYARPGASSSLIVDSALETPQVGGVAFSTNASGQVESPRHNCLIQEAVLVERAVEMPMASTKELYF